MSIERERINFCKDENNKVRAFIASNVCKENLTRMRKFYSGKDSSGDVEDLIEWLDITLRFINIATFAMRNDLSEPTFKAYEIAAFVEKDLSFDLLADEIVSKIVSRYKQVREVFADKFKDEKPTLCPECSLPF